MSLLGIVFCAASGGIMKYTQLGSDPYQCFCNGMNHLFPIDFGTLCLIIALVMLIAIYRLDRSFINIGTVMSLFLTGYVVDFADRGCQMLFGDPSMPLRMGLMAFSLVLMCASASMYMTSALGVSTYDFIALYIAKIQKKLPFRFVRILTDLACVLLGLCMGYAPGVGTLITALFMGPLISFFNRNISEPLLNGKKARRESLS